MCMLRNLTSLPGCRSLRRSTRSSTAANIRQILWNLTYRIRSAHMALPALALRTGPIRKSCGRPVAEDDRMKALIRCMAPPVSGQAVFCFPVKRSSNNSVRLNATIIGFLRVWCTGRNPDDLLTEQDVSRFPRAATSIQAARTNSSHELHAFVIVGLCAPIHFIGRDADLVSSRCDRLWCSPVAVHVRSVRMGAV